MLNLVSPWSPSVMRSLPWAARADDAAGHNPLDPDDALYYEDGEWLEDTAAGGSLARGSTVLAGALAGESAWPTYQIFGERGRTDLPVMAGAGRGAAGKVTVIRIHDYEADTDVCGALALAGTRGDALSVWNLTLLGGIRRGLNPVVGAGAYTLAYLVSVDAAAGTIRFLKQ